MNAGGTTNGPLASAISSSTVAPHAAATAAPEVMNPCPAMKVKRLRGNQALLRRCNRVETATGNAPKRRYVVATESQEASSTTAARPVVAAVPMSASRQSNSVTINVDGEGDQSGSLPPNVMNGYSASANGMVYLQYIYQVPEPASMALFALGLLALTQLRRRKSS